MSGEVIVTRRGKWAEVSLRQNMRRSIAVGRDGTGGPAEYFAGVQREFDEWIDAAMPGVDAYLDTVAEEYGLIPLDADRKGSRKHEAESQKVLDKIELVYWSTATSQPQEIRRELADAVQRVVDAGRPGGR